MKSLTEAINLFDTMYSMRKLRDGAEHCLSLSEVVHLSPESVRMYERNASEFNTESNEAMRALFALGYTAGRSEETQTPTMWKNGAPVAYWHDFGCVELA